MREEEMIIIDLIIVVMKVIRKRQIMNKMREEEMMVIDLIIVVMKVIRKRRTMNKMREKEMVIIDSITMVIMQAEVGKTQTTQTTADAGGVAQTGSSSDR